ncbi:DUF6269 family protein [Streptomyces sp. NPDC087866]|uniref:DUF6269 family protein n=1 Tax=unclassified Streptomyces TaxID=2593676 RepID=UPI002259EC8C|nr:DUF6269 family protein [Streptomyces sp. NBC_01789]MCX4446042.1 hypothetical protein [Streptomyces sp. NBC_01789]
MMYDKQPGPTMVQHPLEFLAEIEQREATAQEILLRDTGAPWTDLLAEYVDALTGLATPGTAATGYIAAYGLDEGHAGGCG